TENHEGQIVALGVAPMYRRQGIGRLILAYFLDESRGIVGGVHAYVPDSSEYLAAQLFLRECGFPDSRLDRKKEAIKFQRSLM
ncbi:MAG: GNAT family N-acetyltransferase, partial [bacterium]